jgi:homoprotocatechuate degradation regulator HpaR
MKSDMKHLISYPNLPQRLLKARDELMVHFRPILNHFGVTEQQWRILRALDQQGQLEPREIGDLCQISSPSMAGVLARMEQAGLVERNRMEGDQRRVIVTLSQQSRALLGQMGPLIDLQYSYIEQACGTQIFIDLLSVLEGFIERKKLPVRQVSLPQSAAPIAD